MNTINSTATNKLELIDFIVKKKVSSKNFSKLIDLSFDKDEEVRFRSLEALSSYPNPNVVERMLDALNDTDSLVRTTAIESLSNIKLALSEEILLKYLDDESETVRIATYRSLTSFNTKNVENIISGKLSILKGVERVSALSTLCNMNINIYIHDLIKLLKSESYLVRCATSNALSYFIDSDYSNEILNALRDAYKVEQSEAVKESIAEII